jgi:molybdopterin-guanine dinucleotide biosynthesis protein A
VIAGIVLAGGAGRRMDGVDKLALEVGGRTLLDRVLAAASDVCDRLVVVGPSRPVSVPDVTFASEAIPGGGPVPAVRAGLECVGDVQLVLVLAADLPLLTGARLRLLLEGLAGDAEAAAALDHQGRPNPLLAAYAAPDLLVRSAGLEPGMPAAALLPARPALVDLGPEATLNVNRPGDLERARAMLAAPDVRAGGRGTPPGGRSAARRREP